MTQAKDSGAAERTADNAPALTGIRVLDFTTVVMGPYATQILAELGADVIKLESPEGDSTRFIEPMKPVGMGAMFLNANRNKRGIVLDLKRPDGLAACLKILAGVDVFITNVRTGGLTRLGLGYQQLQATHPRLVYVSLQGYGDTGPYAGMPAYEDLIQGMTVIPDLMQKAVGTDPVFIPINIADRTTGLHAVNAVLAALIERGRSGKGQSISLPMFEALTHLVLGDHLAGRTFEPANGEAGYDRLLTPHRRPYATRDGHICILLYTETHWQSFLTLCPDRAALEQDPRLQGVLARRRNFALLYRVIKKLISTRTTAEWLEELRRLDIPTAPVRRLDDLIDDPHHAANGFFQYLDAPDGGKLKAMRLPGTWSRSQFKALENAPLLGEHTEQILAETGYDESQIAGMLNSGAARGVNPKTAG